MINRPIIFKSSGRGGPVGQQLLYRAIQRPVAAAALLLGGGLTLGLGVGFAGNLAMHAELQEQRAEVAATQQEAQREINALAARLGELQAEANRLNALGERLTRIGQLQDGEFDFNKPVGVGGDEGVAEDMPREMLDGDLASLDMQFRHAGSQLSVLESLLFNRQLDMASVPAGEPIDSYITSHYGYRADPFRGGRKFHAGIDFEADVGDPVKAVADGVVAFAGNKSGYGYTVEIDHGNGFMTRYAHNSRLVRKVGEPIRAGQEIAKAGSTGRSTGAHVHFEVWQDGRAVNPRQFLGQRSPLTG